MNIVNIIIFFLALSYKKPGILDAAPVRWFKALNIIIFSSVGLIVINSIPSLRYHILIMAASIFPAAILSYLVLSKPVFEGRKQLLVAWLPLVVIKSVSEFISFLASEFYQRISDYMKIAAIFALIWAIAMVIYNNRQGKKLRSERLKSIEKERELEIAAKLKTELEAQVKERTNELTFQNEQLEQALESLKSTQAQLIHAEKMASFGELTAGIAHEIQNPLNFVNNFSELNSELIVELKAELAKGNYTEVGAIANDISENEAKITHHGKRADDIVKSMLAHSRSSSGEMVLVDINVLAEEYLRLSYHGLQAKDKTFKADFKTDLDPTLPLIKLIPQDIGRVLLNIMINAFYAVSSVQLPLIIISTKNLGDKMQITISDNGPGIPDAIKDKIFQPFFTTKPTGQGTGLGLSLSYDIVKAHGGEIKVESKEGNGSTFIIHLPIL